MLEPRFQSQSVVFPESHLDSLGETLASLLPGIIPPVLPAVFAALLKTFKHMVKSVLV